MKMTLEGGLTLQRHLHRQMARWITIAGGRGMRLRDGDVDSNFLQLFFLSIFLFLLVCSISLLVGSVALFIFKSVEIDCLARLKVGCSITFMRAKPSPSPIHMAPFTILQLREQLNHHFPFFTRLQFKVS